MFSYFEKQSRAMAFRSDSIEFARHGVATFAANTLNAWLDGREKTYAVRDVLREIRVVYGAGGEVSARLIERALSLPSDDPARVVLITQAVQTLERQLRGNPAGIE